MLMSLILRARGVSCRGAAHAGTLNHARFPRHGEGSLYGVFPAAAASSAWFSYYLGALCARLRLAECLELEALAAFSDIDVDGVAVEDVASQQLASQLVADGLLY